MLLFEWLWTKLMMGTKQECRPPGPPSPSHPKLNLMLALLLLLLMKRMQQLLVQLQLMVWLWTKPLLTLKQPLPQLLVN